MTVLRMAGVTAGYGNVPVLFDVDLEVDEGETVALLGANGAGKTTLLRAISGVVQVASGTIELHGQRIERWGSDRRVELGLAHVPEGRLIFGTLSVEENIRMGAHVFRKDERKVLEGLERSYAIFPVLKDRRRQAAGTLSGGEQQMLAIARGLASNPKLLAIDEASFGLAPLVAEQVFGIIRDINVEGVSILLVEQNVPRSLEIADRAYVLEIGRIVFTGTAAEAQQHPEFADFYLGGEAEDRGPTRPRRRFQAQRAKLPPKRKTRRTTKAQGA